MVRKYFMDIYSANMTPYIPWLVPPHRYPRLSLEELQELEPSFTEEEVKKALFDMPHTKLRLRMATKLYFSNDAGITQRATLLN